jgi:hypothetical protein
MDVPLKVSMLITTLTNVVFFRQHSSGYLDSYLRRSGLDDREIDDERKGRKHLTWEDEAGGKVKYETYLVLADEFKSRRYLKTTFSFCFRRKEMQTRVHMLHSPLF